MKVTFLMAAMLIGTMANAKASDRDFSKCQTRQIVCNVRLPDGEIRTVDISTTYQQSLFENGGVSETSSPKRDLLTVAAIASCKPTSSAPAPNYLQISLRYASNLSETQLGYSRFTLNAHEALLSGPQTIKKVGLDAWMKDSPPTISCNVSP
jgi:hypothetical protein